jgi:hypothetical protein
MEKLSFKCGPETEILLQYIIENLSEEQSMEVEVEREFDKVSGVGGEPFTVTAILTLTPIITIAVTRLIERWIEARKQEKQMILIIEAFRISEVAGKKLAEIAKNNTTVSYTQEFIKKQDIQ